MKVIQENGDRHYATKHGIYVIVNFMEGYSYDVKTWEIFAPKGLNFDTCHSLIEDSLGDVKEHIGSATNHCDDTCGCEYFLKVNE